MFAKIKDKYFSGLTKNTFLLTFASFFADVSTEMLYPVLPIYLTQYVGASGGIVGLIEGLATAIQNIIQGFSGYLSDRWQNRKYLALFGFSLSAISKPLIGLASSWETVLLARSSDRLGAGTRSAPRDALVAASVEEKDKGKAFGMEGFGDNAGAFLGPLITLFLFFYLSVNIHSIFYLSIIPGLLAVSMIFLLNDDRKKNVVKTTQSLIFSLRQFPKAYWKYIAVTILFGLGNSSNLFLILQLKENGLSLIMTIAVYALYNLVAALFSYPAGHWSDKIGRKIILLLAFIIYFITYLGFALSSNVYFFGVLFVLYGLFQGAFRAVGKSFASDFIPKEQRAGAVGWYSTAVGISGLFASLIAGLMWDKVSHTSVFLIGSLFAFVGTVALLIFVPDKRSLA